MMKNQYTGDPGGKMTDHGLEPYSIPGIPEQVGHASRNAMREVAATQARNGTQPSGVAGNQGPGAGGLNYTHVGKRRTSEVG